MRSEIIQLCLLLLAVGGTFAQLRKGEKLLDNSHGTGVCSGGYQSSSKLHIFKAAQRESVIRDLTRFNVILGVFES